jgi:hypothetical protein
MQQRSSNPGRTGNPTPEPVYSGQYLREKREVREDIRELKMTGLLICTLREILFSSSHHVRRHALDMSL